MLLTLSQRISVLLGSSHHHLLYHLLDNYKSPSSTTLKKAPKHS